MQNTFFRNQRAKASDNNLGNFLNHEAMDVSAAKEEQTGSRKMETRNCGVRVDVSTSVEVNNQNQMEKTQRNEDSDGCGGRGGRLVVRETG